MSHAIGIGAGIWLTFIMLNVAWFGTLLYAIINERADVPRMTANESLLLVLSLLLLTMWICAAMAAHVHYGEPTAANEQRPSWYSRSSSRET